jgi:acetyl-CoA C-acetyltransferase
VGYGGLPAPAGNITVNDMSAPNGSAPGNFAQLASAYRAKYNISRDKLKEAIAHVSWKSHQNGAKKSEGPSAKTRHHGKDHVRTHHR